MTALRRRLEPRLLASWYAPRRDALALALAPLEAIYASGLWLRAALRRAGWRPAVRLPVPVVVVGNLTAGGSGKTPMVIWLARQLVDRGLRPGLLCRGYGGHAGHWPQRVDARSDAAAVGDEALLLALKTGCAVAAGPDRVAAARVLLADGGVDLLISDDGLQHAALARDLEIVMVHGRRRFGNRRLLPAGPLREPLQRLERCDFVIEREVPGDLSPVPGGGGAGPGGDANPSHQSHPGSPGSPGRLRLVRAALYRLAAGDDVPGLYGEELALSDLRGRRLHAFAGIADPGAFFAALRGLGARPVEHARADHHRYTARDFAGLGDEPVIMTAKDAVKCRRLAPAGTRVLDIEMAPDDYTAGRLLQATLALRPRGAG